MPFGNSFRDRLLDHLLNGAAIANISDNAASADIDFCVVSLHSDTPGGAGHQATNELSYTNYARVPVTRDGGGWTVSNGATNASAITYPQAGAGAIQYARFFGIGTSTNGNGSLMIYGSLSATLAIADGITPQFAAGELDLT
jgi:hypothetical protein